MKSQVLEAERKWDPNSGGCTRAPLQHRMSPEATGPSVALPLFFSNGASMGVALARNKSPCFGAKQCEFDINYLSGFCEIPALKEFGHCGKLQLLFHGSGNHGTCGKLSSGAAPLTEHREWWWGSPSGPRKSSQGSFLESLAHLHR